MGFVVDKVTLMQGFIQAISFSFAHYNSTSTLTLLPAEAGSIGLCKAAVPRDSVSLNDYNYVTGPNI
jgi:hypothetical protein